MEKYDPQSFNYMPEDKDVSDEDYDEDLSELHGVVKFGEDFEEGFVNPLAAKK